MTREQQAEFEKMAEGMTPADRQRWQAFVDKVAEERYEAGQHNIQEAING
jgi:hypothetical protein